MSLYTCLRILAFHRNTVHHICSSTTLRNISFFNKVSAEQLWKGVSSVSNAGKKRGRGRSVWRPRDLNRGQIIGVGKANMIWPGLSSPIIKGKELVQQIQLPTDPERENKINMYRDSSSSSKKYKVNALDRGWSGNKMPGKSIGPPDPTPDGAFEDFNTIIIELKQVFVMKGNLGRRRRLSVFVVTGNSSGLAGFGTAKSIDNRAAIRKAKNRAGQKLMHIELYNGHTIYHDFFSQFSKTKIFAKKMPEGSGLVCHRAIKACCEMLGIKDLYAKIEGSNCVQHIVKAFFIGLLQQRNHRELSEEKQLLLVESRKQSSNLPEVIAKPSLCRQEEQIGINEVLDFTQFALKDRVVLNKKKHPPFYTRMPHWTTYLKKQEYHRNKDQVRLHMLVQSGEIRSFLTDEHPECKPGKLNLTQVADVE